MRFGTVIAIAGATMFGVCLATLPADAACQTAKCVKQSATASRFVPKAHTAQTVVNKRKHFTSRKLRSMHAKHGAHLADAAKRGKASASLPASIANAHAELPQRNPSATPKSFNNEQAKNLSALNTDDVVTLNGVQVAASSEMNEIDRAANDSKSEQKEEMQPELKNARPDVPAVEPVRSAGILKAVPKSERQVLENTDSDTWNKTSLIGKLFVAFGSLLTLASAARLMIA